MYLFYSIMSFSILSTIYIFNQFVNNYSVMYNNSLLLSTNYNNSNHQKIDKEFFLVINQLNKDNNYNDLNNKNICFKILGKIREKEGDPKEYLNRFKIASKTKSFHYKFINSCALSDGNYRLVFINNSLYESIPTFFSCKTVTSSYCKFEIESSF